MTTTITDADYVDRDDQPLKYVMSFAYLGSNIASTEAGVKFGFAKHGALWVVIVWKSTQLDNIKRYFFNAVVETIVGL